MSADKVDVARLALADELLPTAEDIFEPEITVTLRRVGTVVADHLAAVTVARPKDVRPRSVRTCAQLGEKTVDQGMVRCETAFELADSFGQSEGPGDAAKCIHLR